MDRKNVKRSLAILLATVLVITVGFFAGTDSRLHAEEYYDYEAPEFEPTVEVDELVFDDLEDSEDSEEAEEPEGSEEPEETEDLEESEEPEETEESEESDYEEEYEFDPVEAYNDYQGMSLEELNDYLAGLSEEELAALEKYAESLDEDAEEFVDKDAVFTVSFLDWDGTELSSQTVAYGGRAVPPAENPVREGYVFYKWDKDFTVVESDITVTAVYHTEEESNLLNSISVEINYVDVDVENVKPGDTIKMDSTVTGAPVDKTLVYHWQFSRNGGLTWEDAEDGSGTSYEYILSEDNITFKWHLVLQVF